MKPEDGMQESAPEPIVRTQLTRMLENPIFSRAGRVSRLFQYLVVQALAGRASELTEKSIGQQLYVYKENDFDPTVNTDVRVDMRELRRKLLEYYVESPEDPVHIAVPGRTFVPRFRVTPPKTEPLHPVVVRMLEQLKSSDVRLRLEALDHFHKRAQADPVAMRSIVEALLDPDLRVRARAVRATVELKLGSDEVVSNLIGLLNTRRDETPGERRDAAGLRAMAAHALGVLGPAAKVAAPDLLENLEDLTSVAERAAIALVKMGVTGDPRFRKALINLVGEESWAATSILLEMGPEAAGYVPSLIEMLRASAATGNWPVKLQGYVIEVLSQTGEPGMSALEQSLTNGTPQEQVAIALAWLELDSSARDAIRRLVPDSRIAPILLDSLNSGSHQYVPLPRSIFPRDRWLPCGLSEPGRIFVQPDSLDHWPSGAAARSATGILMLGLKESERAWPVLISALTSETDWWAAYGAIVLGKLDPAVAREAVPELVRAFERYQEGSSRNPAICEDACGDRVDAQAVLIGSLGTVGDQSTIEAFRPLVGSEYRHVACTARRIIAAIEAQPSVRT